MVKIVPRLTLTYFNFGGRAEAMRLAAAIGKIPFYNKAIQYKDWAASKHSFPLGQLPVLEVEWQEDGRKEVIVQSCAILRYFGKLGGLYPDDLMEAMKVDSIVDTVEDATGPIELTLNGAVKSFISNEEWSKEKVLEIRDRIVANKEYGLPFYLTFFETTLRDNGTGWMVGTKITIADLNVNRLLSWIKAGLLDNIPASILDEYPMLLALNNQIEKLPEVQEWRTNHPMPYTDFAFLM